MKKYIGGSRYDTDTARLIGEDGYSYPGGFSWWSEKLYCTKAGKYFIYGKGGPMSRYSRKISYNETSGSEEIIPVSEEEARKWAEEHLDADEVELFFGGESKEETARLQVFVSSSLIEKLDEKCDELHCPRADIVSTALRKYLGE